VVSHSGRIPWSIGVEVVELPPQVFDVPAQMAARCAEGRRDSSFGHPPRERVPRDAQDARRFTCADERRVVVLQHHHIVAPRVRFAPIGPLGSFGVLPAAPIADEMESVAEPAAPSPLQEGLATVRVVESHVTSGSG
jgi:hypothetical protein